MSQSEPPDLGLLAARFAPIVAVVGGFAGVTAVSLGGSTVSGLSDQRSDVDLHVFWRAPLAPPAERAAALAPLADAGSVTADVRSWGLEDYFKIGGRKIELVYVELDAFRALVERAYGEGLSGEGFVTAPLAFVANGHLLHDPSGELAALQARLRAEYPEATRRKLLADNPALLRVYLELLELAQMRRDLLSVQHRRYTLQMVFFNLLFAINRRYDPGEKRLLVQLERCPLRPDAAADRWSHAACLAADDSMLAYLLGTLVDDVCALARSP